MLLTGLLSQLAQLVFYRTQDCLPRDGTAHNGLDPPISIINPENAPLGNLQAI